MLRKISNLIFLAVLFATSVPSNTFAATTTKLVCVQSNGTISIRSRCKRGETRLSALSLNQAIASSPEAVGPTGPQGVVGTVGNTGPTGATGPQGPQGVPGIKGVPGRLDLSGCRLTAEGYDTNFANPSNGVLYAEVFCNSNTEFLLEEESYVNFLFDGVGSKAALQGRLTYFQNVGGDTRDYGVGIYANRFLTVGQGIFELIVRGVCCPR